MPITFTIYSQFNYYVARFVGAITDDELVHSYRTLFNSEEWSSEYDELADLSEFDTSQITQAGMTSLAELMTKQCVRHNWKPLSAVYVKNDLQFGITRMYVIKTEDHETSKLFRSYDEAHQWLVDSRKE